MKINEGDIIAVIDEPITGKVISIQNDEVTIESEDGFDMSFGINEIVKIESTTLMNPSYTEVQKNLQEKEIFKKNPKRSSIKKPRQKEIPPMEVDLHIEKLVKSTKGMAKYDIVLLQIDVAKRQLDFAIQKKIPRVVFIHGVGQGVLKEELKYLFRQYDNLSISEGNYRKYGMGATEVYIVQNPK